MISSNPAMDSLAKHVASSAEIDAREKARHRCQSVLEHLYDSYNGYKACAEDCKEIALKILFQGVAVSRFDFIGQLSSVIRTDFGLEPVTSGSGLAVAHQKWLDVKAFFTDGVDKTAIVAEVYRCEIHLIHQYELALSEPEHLTDKVCQVLQEQVQTIRKQDAAVYDL